ncbi:MAG: hypothetical protein QXF40_03385, partial [Metallosphaera sp.]
MSSSSTPGSNPNATSTPKMDDDFLLNRGAVVACLASLGRFESTQINNMLTFIQNNRNIKELELLIIRQAGRDVIDALAADEIAKTILEIGKSYQNENERVEKVKKFLEYVKWLYESLNMKGNKETAQLKENAKGTRESEEEQLRKAKEQCYKLTFG